MAKQNINPLDVLKQVQAEQNAILSDLESIKNSENLEFDFQDNPDFQEILTEVGKQSSDISQHLSEIKNRLNG